MDSDDIQDRDEYPYTQEYCVLKFCKCGNLFCRQEHEHRCPVCLEIGDLRMRAITWEVNEKRRVSCKEWAVFNARMRELSREGRLKDMVTHHD